MAAPSYTLRDATYPRLERCEAPAVPGISSIRAGSCPGPAPEIAAANDRVWAARINTGNDDDTTLKLMTRIGLQAVTNGLSTLYYQYGLNRTDVTWEDIIAEVRNVDGSPLSRAELAQLGYNRKSKYLQDSALAVSLAGITSKRLLDAVPLYSDYWLPPSVVVLGGFFGFLFVLVMMLYAMKRLSRPEVHVNVYPAGCPAPPL